MPRVCIKCSKEFESTSEDVIPVCPECEAGPAQPPQTEWRALKDGVWRDVGSEAGVREWVRRNEIHPNDMLVSPEGKSDLAKKFPQFHEVFRIQRMQKTTPGLSDMRRWAWKIHLPRRWLLAMVTWSIVITAAWFLYRIVRYAPPPSTDLALAELVKEIRTRVPAPARPADALLDQAIKTIARDQPTDIDAVVLALEQALVTDPSSEEILAQLTEAYGLAAGAYAETSMVNRAMQSADLLTRLYPDRVESLIAKTRAFLGSENWAAAQQASQQAFQKDPTHPRVLLARSQVLLVNQAHGGSDVTEQVIAYANSALAADPKQMEAYDLIGQAHEQKGDPITAIKAYEQRLQKIPNDSKALYRLGAIASRATHYVMANEWFQESLRSNASFVPARLGVAEIYKWIDGKVELAERHYRDVTTRFRRTATPNEGTLAQRELADILLHTGRAKEAVEIARTFPVLISHSPLLAITKAAAFEANNSPQEAVTVLQDFLQSHSGNYEVILALAQQLNRHGFHDLPMYRMAIEVSPQRVEPYFLLIQILVDQKRWEEALDIANAAVTRAGLAEHSDIWVSLDQRTETVPLDGFLKGLKPLEKHYSDMAIVSALMGLLHLHLGSPKAALTAFLKSSQLSKPTDYIWTYLGRAHLQLQHFDRAAVAFEMARAYNPASPQATYNLGVAYLKLKKWNEAQKLLTEVSNDPTWAARALYRLGDLAFARGQTKEASEHWKQSLVKDPRLIPPWQSLLRLVDLK